MSLVHSPPCGPLHGLSARLGILLCLTSCVRNACAVEGAKADEPRHRARRRQRDHAHRRERPRRASRRTSTSACPARSTRCPARSLILNGIPLESLAGSALVGSALVGSASLVGSALLGSALLGYTVLGYALPTRFSAAVLVTAGPRSLVAAAALVAAALVAAAPRRCRPSSPPLLVAAALACASDLARISRACRVGRVDARFECERQSGPTE